MNKQPMHPDEAAASLAFATKLSEGLMPKASPSQPDQSQEPSQTLETAPESTETPQEPQSPIPDPNEAKFTELGDKIDQMKAEMKNEVSNIKDTIIKTIETLKGKENT